MHIGVMGMHEGDREQFIDTILYQDPRWRALFPGTFLPELMIGGKRFCLGAYTILVNGELIFLTSHLFQAETQAVCFPIEEAITTCVEERCLGAKAAHLSGHFPTTYEAR